MKELVLHEEGTLGPWICDRLDTNWLPGRGACIGLRENGEYIVGVLFDSFNGASVCMHIAAIPGRRWMNRELLWICFDYPFNQLKVKKILALIAGSNRDSLEFVENIGFVPEATLTDAHPDGSLIIKSMTRSQCRWLNMRSPFHGKTQSTATA